MAHFRRTDGLELHQADLEIIGDRSGWMQTSGIETVGSGEGLMPCSSLSLVVGWEGKSLCAGRGRPPYASIDPDRFPVMSGIIGLRVHAKHIV